MLFSKVIGQAAVKEKLLLSVRQNRVSHAQLFLGSEGSGALALALALAQYMNCENRLESDSCGKCSSCMKAEKMVHPDIHFSFPVYKLKSGSENPALSDDFIKPWREAVTDNPYLSLGQWLQFIEAENKQGNISADECRQIIHRLQFKTFESPFKVMIIWMAEQLGKEGNILLKLLEEPPPNTLLILIAENRDQVISTVLSRCQLVAVPGITNEDLMEVLLQKHSLERNEAQRILRQSEGNYLEALALMGKQDYPEAGWLKRWMRALVEKKESELQEWVEEMSRIGREKQKGFFRYVLEFFRECVILDQAPSLSLLQDEEKNMARWFGQRLSGQQWQQLVNWINEAHYQVERNAHPKILLTDLSLRMREVITAKKLPLPVAG
jgi:DNA polymerase-3 subunit delta'